MVKLNLKFEIWGGSQREGEARGFFIHDDIYLKLAMKYLCWHISQ